MVPLGAHHNKAADIHREAAMARDTEGRKEDNKAAAASGRRLLPALTKGPSQPSTIDGYARDMIHSRLCIHAW